MMFEAPPDAATAAVGAVLVGAFCLTLGWLITDAFLGRRLDAIACWGLAFVGLCSYAVALMVLHMATGGAVFSNVLLVRLVTASTFTGLLLLKLSRPRKRRRRLRPSTEAVMVVSLLLIAQLVWSGAVAGELPLDFRGDTRRAAGWTSQLLNGETTPSAVITGDIPNFYPWLTHALLALLSRITPGGRALHGLAPLQLLQVAGPILALFALGLALTRKRSTALGAALFGGLTGGVGFFALRSLDLVMNPRGPEVLRYGGDLIAERSYNASMYQLPPPWPRDLAYVLLISFLLLAVLGLSMRNRVVLTAGGVALGLTGLTGGETFYLGVAVVLFLIIWPPDMSRLRIAAVLLAPALAVAGLWFVPQVVNYLSYGYTDITLGDPIEIPPLATLVAWGVVTPLGIYGIVRAAPVARREAGKRVAFAFLIVAAASIVGLTRILPLFGDAFATLGRAHRYWPLLYLAFALFAALGTTELLERLRSRRPLAVALAVLIALLALPSPVVAGFAWPGSHTDANLLGESLRGDETTLFNLVSPKSGGRCVVAAPNRLAESLWSYSGYRMVFYRQPGYSLENPARLRWDGIYDELTPVRQRLQDNRRLTRATGDPGRWRITARRYGVDVVVVFTSRAESPAVAGLESTPATDVEMTVVRLSDCGT